MIYMIDFMNGVSKRKFGTPYLLYLKEIICSFF